MTSCKCISCSQFEQAPLHLAAEGGHTAVMKILFSHGTNAIHAMDKVNFTKGNLTTVCLE